MNRRRFLKALIVGAASVAVGLKLASKQPEISEPKWVPVNTDKAPAHSVAWKAYYAAAIVNPSYAVRINSV